MACLFTVKFMSIENIYKYYTVWYLKSLNFDKYCLVMTDLVSVLVLISVFDKKIL